MCVGEGGLERAERGHVAVSCHPRECGLGGCGELSGRLERVQGVPRREARRRDWAQTRLDDPPPGHVKDPRGRVVL